MSGPPEREEGVPPAPLLTFTCQGCGGAPACVPGTTTMRCPNCSVVSPLEVVNARGVLGVAGKRDWDLTPDVPVSTVAPVSVHCERCGAQESTKEVARRCSYCATPQVLLEHGPAQRIDAVIPFRVDDAHAGQSVRAWLRSRWFAPTALQVLVRPEPLRATYLPFWDFDLSARADYSGWRGDYYWENETYTVVEHGKRVKRTRQVRKTAWSPAYGSVWNDFVDLMVQASTAASARRLEKTHGFDCGATVPPHPGLLAGLESPRYSLDCSEAYPQAQERVREAMRAQVVHAIGGDEQRIESLCITEYAHQRRLVVAPVWITDYSLAGRSYQAVVNGQNGKAAGERPYSPAKITAAMALVVLLGILAYVLLSR